MARARKSKGLRGMTTIEALLIAAAFIIVGVIGLLTFQNMGKAAAQSLRANAIATADRAGFDVTVEVLNGQLSGVLLAYAQSGQSVGSPITGTCIVAQNGATQTGVQSNAINPPLAAGQSASPWARRSRARASWPKTGRPNRRHSPTR